MSGVNKVIIVGNLGMDPEVKYSNNGTCITRISVATTESWKDKDGERQEKTSWHRIIFFGKLAEIVGEYLQVGRQVYVEGKLNYRDYEKEGVTVYVTEIIGEEMQMLGGKPNDGDRGGQQRQGREARGSSDGRSRQGRSSDGRSNEGGRSPGRSSSNDDPFPDDDIPF